MSNSETITFEQLPLDPALMKSITELGYTMPSPIQQQALPILLGDNTDFIGLAATGTGKTAAFSLPLLGRIDTSKKAVQAIILCPTRELCMQVSGQVNLLGKHLGVRSLPIYGGAGYDEQLRGLRQGVPVVVGTPGRMIDHIERGTLKLDNVKIVVLDEADEMISMGFKEDMETILETVPEDQSNTWLFSATMSSQVRRVADEFLSKPKMVQVNRTEMLSATVEQIGYLTQEKNKPEVLCKIIDFADDFYGVIFCQMKSLVVDLVRYLSERGYKVDCLHGDMSQAARESAMLAFRQKRVKILVCTDVASRGLDVKEISHVVNYSLPRELDSYVHRIGRTGRAGKAGIAISLVTPSHRHLVDKIERMTKSKMIKGEVPTRKEIGMKKVAKQLAVFNSVENSERALSLLDENWKAAVAAMTPEEVTARFLSLMFPFVFNDKVERPEMERTPRVARPEGSERPQRPRFDRGGGGYSRGASAERKEKPKFERPAHKEESPAAPKVTRSESAEIDQNRPFDAGPPAKRPARSDAPERAPKRTAFRGTERQSARPIRTSQAEAARPASPRHGSERPSAARPYNAKSASGRPSPSRPYVATSKSKKQHFAHSVMKEGSRPPAKFTPRSARGGDAPPRRRPND